MSKYLVILILLMSFKTFSYDFKTFTLLGDLEKKNDPTYDIEAKSSRTGEHTNFVYSSILGAISSSYTSIGQSQADAVLNDQGIFNLGSRSASGFTWQKPFGNFLVVVNRSLSPDLFDDSRWIVDDQLEIIIDAQSFLTQLSKDNKIKISDDSLAMYAGITFKRIFSFMSVVSLFIYFNLLKASKVSFLNLFKGKLLTIFE